MAIFARLWHATVEQTHLEVGSLSQAVLAKRLVEGRVEEADYFLLEPGVERIFIILQIAFVQMLWVTHSLWKASLTGMHKAYVLGYSPGFRIPMAITASEASFLLQAFLFDFGLFECDQIELVQLYDLHLVLEMIFNDPEKHEFAKLFIGFEVGVQSQSEAFM